uniref:Helicase SKI2W-like n=1 Tax=Phallusia mammillata TaxID=59560 RepID=A0A6F9DSU8_9ASCI|nr:helicase SKI2W-like [Phallusia mammillata]
MACQLDGASTSGNPLDLRVEFVETDAGAGIAVIEDDRSPKEQISVLPSLLPIGIPPVLKSIQDEIREEFFNHPEELEVHQARHTQRVFPRETDLASLFAIGTSQSQTSIQVKRNMTTGEMLGFYEEETDTGGTLTAKNSCSLFRTPGPPSQSIRGTTTNFPFWPGGMDEANVDELLKASADTIIDFKTGLKSCPPGLDHGIDYSKFKSPQASGVFNLADILDETNFENIFQSEENPSSPDSLQAQEDGSQDDISIEQTKVLDNLLPEEKQQTDNTKDTNASEQKRTQRSPLEEVWAEKVDISSDVVDFHKKIPKMAHEWPFELDTFQKQAVLKLENHECVFVAAHTSAGKTVVAEYAIALSAKHMTRVVYTSPIKALSNQKFRDFKQTFGDVGLITGDVQIHPEAFCLIMTTEILRSMLYNGSDVIRDLEWVIFDEVHYINDMERGVVWEEVLIMLPEHCNVILLSATVPNTLEFANWIGKTKRKKIYVISTLKRPVPLEHYLYTGNSTKTSDELFMLVDSQRRFLTTGYKKAVAAKDERSTKHSKSFGARNQRGGNMAADKNIWLSLINRLRKKDQLPVVAFTFSRRRCDENAARLESLDLTSSAEKSEVHIFFNRCAQRLKGTDRKLPQVLQMASLLEKGVGVHHSGILPILKEVVEMLFAKGLVKLLFATETFAMGVNMPARTVVFDSIRKHDGTTMRNLLPGEYIQMAGRAGRRGLDSTGTVIVLCKGDVPESSELNQMMLGRPTKLESQFRLTYSMILNLLRVEQLRVEEVMKRSFSEFHARKDSKTQEERMRKLQEQIDEKFDITELLARSDYERYLDNCEELLHLRAHVQEETLFSNAGMKMLQAGRVMVLDCAPYQQHVAVLLKINSKKTEKTLTVLVMTQEADVSDDVTTSKWLPASLLRKTLFRPERKASQVVTEVSPKHVSYITDRSFKIPADKIIADHERRKIPRFSLDPPDQSTVIATQELLRLVESNPDGLNQVDLLSDLGLNQIELVEEVMRMRSLEDSIATAFTCVNLPRFDSQVDEVEAYLKLKKEFNNIKYLLSEASLHLLPEYQQRVEVLKELRYVDTGGAVQLKGRVACEISSHEIVLTELVFENVFATLDPVEIVALLSCVVFQQKVDLDEVNFTPRLKEGMHRIIEVATMVGATQWQLGIRQPVEDFVATLKFGLVEVVYEWAKGTTFKDITNLTSVQEGMIVRTIQRLNETCHDVRNAARVIGDPSLHAKMEKCSELIKRDIVFAASLYTH